MLNKLLTCPKWSYTIFLQNYTNIKWGEFYMWFFFKWKLYQSKYTKIQLFPLGYLQSKSTIKEAKQQVHPNVRPRPQLMLAFSLFPAPLFGSKGWRKMRKHAAHFLQKLFLWQLLCLVFVLSIVTALGAWGARDHSPVLSCETQSLLSLHRAFAHHSQQPNRWVGSEGWCIQVNVLLCAAWQSAHSL